MDQIKRKFRNLSIRASFVIYALLALVAALLLCSFLMNLIDSRKMHIYYKYKEMSRTYEVPEDGAVEITYERERILYIIYDKSGAVADSFTVQNEERVETVYSSQNPENIAGVSVMPAYSDADEAADVILEMLSLITIPVAFCGSMIVCAVLFYRKKLKKPIELLKNAYRKVAENDLDFTLQYDSTDEMGKLCEAFEKMRRSLQENNREMWRQMEERNRLNAAFSHDLRTPLTVLKGHASMLLSSLPEHTVSEEEVTGEIRTMSRHITRLENYVEAMAQLQRLEDIEIRREEIDRRGLLRNLEETGRILCAEKALDFRDFMEEDFLFADEEAISQVYENLLSNALRYAERKIEVTFRTFARFFCIEVSDDGKGFTRTGLEKAASPFYRESKEDGTSHMGLGLNICKILCIKHGGYLTVSNREHGGACVTAAFAVRPDPGC